MRRVKADRWERLMDTLVRAQENDPYFHASDVAWLLRREHRAVVRLVRAERRKHIEHMAEWIALSCMLDILIWRAR